MTSNLIFSLNSILLFHVSKYYKRATGLNGHLCSRYSTLTSCQNGSYYISMNHHRTNNKSTMVKENCIITPCNIITKNVLYVYTRHKNHTFTPSTPTPTPRTNGVMKFTLLINRTLVILIMYSVCLIHA